MLTLAAEEFPLRCGIWERINSWEVVVAALIIVIGWSSVQLGRMYFMWRTAGINTNQCCCNRKDSGDAESDSGS